MSYMKTVTDLENLKSVKSPVFGNEYDFLFERLTNYYIGKLDGKERIKNELKNWDQDAQRLIIKCLSNRLKQEIHLQNEEAL